MERYCVNLFLSWTILVSPSMVIESVAGYCRLGWHLWSLRVCMTSPQDLLAFRVSVDKSGVILIGLLISYLFQSIWCSEGFLYVYGHLIL